MVSDSVLYCTVLYCTVLYCTVTVLYCTVLLLYCAIRVMIQNYTQIDVIVSDRRGWK